MKKILQLLIALVLISVVCVYVVNYFKHQTPENNIVSEETMHIVFGIDNNYVEPLNVTITSILWNNKNNPIQFHVISEDLTLNSKERIRKVISRFHNAKVSFYNMIVPKEFEKITGREDVSKATYLRLYAMELLPKEINKVLYLDGDIIVDGKLKSFYDMPFNDNYIIGVKDSCWEEEHIKRLKQYKLKQYINAGVLFFNMKLLHKECTLNKIVEFVYDNLNNEKINLADQDIINIFWKDKILTTDEIYNTNMRIRMEKKPIVLHYLGNGKPWEGSESWSFYDYIQRIPWHIYNGLYQNVIKDNSYAKTIWYITLRDIYNGSVFRFYKIIDGYNQYINYPITNFISKLID